MQKPRLLWQNDKKQLQWNAEEPQVLPLHAVHVRFEFMRRVRKGLWSQRLDIWNGSEVSSQRDPRASWDYKLETILLWLKIFHQQLRSFRTTLLSIPSWTRQSSNWRTSQMSKWTQLQWDKAAGVALFAAAWYLHFSNLLHHMSPICWIICQGVSLLLVQSRYVPKVYLSGLQTCVKVQQRPLRLKTVWHEALRWGALKSSRMQRMRTVDFWRLMALLCLCRCPVLLMCGANNQLFIATVCKVCERVPTKVFRRTQIRKSWNFIVSLQEVPWTNLRRE